MIWNVMRHLTPVGEANDALSGKVVICVLSIEK